MVLSRESAEWRMSTEMASLRYESKVGNLPNFVAMSIEAEMFLKSVIYILLFFKKFEK